MAVGKVLSYTEQKAADDLDEEPDAMSDKAPTNDFEEELLRLESRIGELVLLTERLKEENRSLRRRQESLMLERAGLLQRNEQVRAKVEGMINRFKAMEVSA